MTDMTPEETKAESIAKMGKDLGEVYYHLWQQVFAVHHKWEEFVTLFGTRPSRIDLLNEAAPRFFKLIEDSLWEDIVIHIARVVDPAQSAGKDTLTLRRLPLLVSTAIEDKLHLAVAGARVACEFCRDWRNRRIAHNDLDLITNPVATPLTPASRDDVVAALNSLIAVLDVVSDHYLGKKNMFIEGGIYGGSLALLYVLDDGVRTRKEQVARWERGETDGSEIVRRRDL